MANQDECARQGGRESRDTGCVCRPREARRCAGVGKNDHRSRAARIPAFTNALGITEGDILTTTGWLHLVAGESDGDYHIQISDSQDSQVSCLIAEVPNPDQGSASEPRGRERPRREGIGQPPTDPDPGAGPSEAAVLRTVTP